MSDKGQGLILDGKVVLITGAAGGQGAAEAALLSSQGATVFATDVQEPLEDLPEKVEFLHLDVTNPDAWQLVVSHICDQFDRIDALVNNAGTVSRARLDDVTIDEWQRVQETNVSAALLGMQAVVPHMQPGSSIVNVCSIAALTSHYAVAYTASKWALRGLSRVASMQYGSRGIRVNAIFPGHVVTPMTSTAPAKFVELSTAQIPLGRLGTPTDVAPLISFLVSDGSSWISGAEIAVDGGQWAHGGMKSIADGLAPPA